MTSSRDRPYRVSIVIIVLLMPAVSALKAAEPRSPSPGDTISIKPRARTVHRYEGHTNGLQSVAVSPNGQWGASTARDGTLRIWNLLTHRQEKVFSYENSSTMGAVAFSPDSSILAVTGEMGVQLWQVDGWEIHWSEENPAYMPLFVALVVFSRDGELLAVARGNEIDLWDVATGRRIKTVSAGRGRVRDIEFGPTSDELLVSGARGTFVVTPSRREYPRPDTPPQPVEAPIPLTHNARLWNWRTGEERFRVDSTLIPNQLSYIAPLWSESPFDSPEWDVNRQRIYVIGADNKIEEWDAETGKRLRAWRQGDVNTLELSESGKFLLAGGDEKVALWHVKSGKLLEVVTLPDVYLFERCLAWNSQNGYFLAINRSENIVHGARLLIGGN